MRLSPTAGTIRVALSVLWMLPLTGTLRAEIVNESGSLREFLAGSEPGAAYDNWVSHVAEAISRPGYNMYAPPALDTQLNGFGGFQVLEDNAPDTAILQLFRDLADALLNGDSAAADLLLQNGPAIDYDLVRFTDTGLGREYWMLREQLDASFTDPGLDPGILDDVVGSFVHGWGLFIFCPQASRPEIVVQVPHPCDDYLSPYIALEFFLEADAGLMMLNGAGREVAHRNETFSNDTSLSDPTRNCEHPFAVIHEQLVDHWQELGQEELVVQVHSYDDLAHRDLKSCVVVGGRYNRIHNPVLVDTGGGSKGLFTNLLQPVFAEDELGFSHDEWRIQDYMSSNQLYPVIVSGGIPDSSLTLSIAPELWGYGESCQWNYTYPDHGDGYPECDAGERAIHIEIDELPTPAHDLGETEYYHITPPAVASWHNFTTAWAFARPVFDNLLVARDSLRAFVDDTAPTTPTNLRVSGFTASSLRIGWRPTLSDRFDTYEVLVDTAATIGPTARLVNNSEEDELCWPGTRQVVIHGLDLLTVYSIGIRARDAQGRVSELSNIVQGMPDDLDAPLVTLPPETTGFSGGVIPVSAEIVDETGVQQATLQWDTGSGWQNVVMENLSGNIWVGSLAPLAPGTVAQLQVIAVDASGHDNTATSSPGILSVMHDLYADGFNGTSDWTHAAFGGNVDQWHLSTTRHSEGTHAWKFGSTGAADYANNAAGWLTSPEYLVPIGASQVRVQFSSWVEAETSGSQPDSCYDGGVVDVSLADGEWQPALLSPVLSKALKGSSQVPLAWPRRMFSGNEDWRSYTLLLPADTRTFRLRMGFVSDGSVVREGWYVDDLRVGVVIPENPELVTDLVIHQIPGNMLQLDWVPVYVATSYRIYAADTVDAPSWTLLGETEETRFTLALQAAQSARWFQVRSVVPDALLHSLERDTAPLRQPRTGVAEPARRTRQQTQGTK